MKQNRSFPEARLERRLLLEPGLAEDPPGRCSTGLCGRSASAGRRHHRYRLISASTPALGLLIPLRRCNLRSRLMKVGGGRPAGDINRSAGWSAFLRANSKVRSQKSSFFSPQPASPLSLPSSWLFAAAAVAATALMHIEGAFEESTSL